MSLESLKVFEDIEVSKCMKENNSEAFIQIIWECDNVPGERFYVHENWRIVAIVGVGRFGVSEKIIVERANKRDATKQLVWYSSGLDELMERYSTKRKYLKEKCSIFNIISSFYEIVVRIVDEYEDLEQKEGFVVDY